MKRALIALSLCLSLATPAFAQETPPTGSTGACVSSNSDYTNVDGHTLSGPVCPTDGQVPAGATARCGDSSYSFSETARGTCSGHGGVSERLR